jgi:uncharacterized membrane protein (UPF0127 family)
MFLAWIFALAIQTMQISLGDQKLTVEIAKTDEDKSKGLMERESLGSNRGMLFIYDEPQILNFWMKNTKIPLSIAFFDKNKVLLQIFDMFPPSSRETVYPTYQSSKPALYALEVNQGWFQKYGIKPNMKFSFLD